MLKMKSGQIRSENKAHKTLLGSWVLVMQYCFRHGQERWCLPGLGLVSAHASQADVFPSLTKGLSQSWPKGSPADRW